MAVILDFDGSLLSLIMNFENKGITFFFPNMIVSSVTSVIYVFTHKHMKKKKHLQDLSPE